MQILHDRIFPIIEIDNHILDYLDPIKDFKQLSLVNSCYNHIVNKNDLYTVTKNFFRSKKTRRLAKKNQRLSKKYPNDLVRACECGRLPLVVYIYNQLRINEIDKYKYVLALLDDAYAYNYCRKYSDQMLHICCWKGHFDIVFWLSQLYPDTIERFNDFYRRKMYMETIKLDVIIWLNNLQETDIEPADDHYEQCIENSVWFYHCHNNLTHPFTFADTILLNNCEISNLDIVIWIYIQNDFDTTEIINIIKDNFFCELHVLLWLYSLVDNFIVTSDLFIEVIDNESLEIVIWAHNLCSHDDNDYVRMFDNIYEHYELNKLVWLYSVNQDIQLYRILNSYGDILDSMLWIYNLVDMKSITVSNMLFKKYCRNGNNNLTIWAYNLAPNNCTIDYNTINDGYLRYDHSFVYELTNSLTEITIEKPVTLSPYTYSSYWYTIHHLPA